MPRPITIAHQAGNRRSSLALAVAKGVDWIEADVWWQRGRVVARHEKSLWGSPILYDKWKVGVAARQPLFLPELCLAALRGPRLLLDMKGAHPLLAPQIVRTLRSLGALTRSALCGQNWSLLDAARGLEPQLQTFYSLESIKQLEALSGRSREALPVLGVSVWEGLLSPEVIAGFRAREIPVLAWTVNSVERAASLVAQGVTGIISDRLDVLAGLRPATDEGFTTGASAGA